MKLFTVGPVEMYESTLQVASKPLPYFRTEEFSKIQLEIERKVIELVHAPENSHLVLLTASGTGAMECSVLNSMTPKDKALVINGGGFGKRFCEICSTLECQFESLNLEFGETLTEDLLLPYQNKGFTTLFVNAHETSTGQLYDLKMLGDFCQRNQMRFVVDAVSSLFVDDIDMDLMNIDILFTGSQKALALSPGLALMVVSPKMYDHIMQNKVRSIYFDLKQYFINMERGQTPFTPAVGIVLELEDRINQIYEKGMSAVVAEHKNRAEYFRSRIKELGITLPPYPLSNGLTPLMFNGNAYDIFLLVKDKYDMMLTPNGGDLHDMVLRIGHMGNLNNSDYDHLIEVLKEVI